MAYSESKVGQVTSVLYMMHLLICIQYFIIAKKTPVTDWQENCSYIKKNPKNLFLKTLSKVFPLKSEQDLSSSCLILNLSSPAWPRPCLVTPPRLSTHQFPCTVMETPSYPAAPPALWVLRVQPKNLVSLETVKEELSATPWQKSFYFARFLDKNPKTNQPKNPQLNQTKQIPTQMLYHSLEGNPFTAS